MSAALCFQQVQRWTTILSSSRPVAATSVTAARTIGTKPANVTLTFERSFATKTSSTMKSSSPLAPPDSSEPLSSSSPYDTVQPEPLYILGGGSIGLFLAASLRIAYGGYPVKLLLRERHAHKIDRRDGTVTICLQLEVPPQQQQSKTQQTQRQRRAPPPRMIRVPAQIILQTTKTTSSDQHQKHPRHRPIQNLIVTTKADQAVVAIRSIESLLVAQQQKNEQQQQQQRILLLCNGALGVRDELLSSSSTTTTSLLFQQQETNPSAALSSSPAAAPAIRLLLGWTSQGAYREMRNENDDDVRGQQGSAEVDEDDMFYVTQGGWGPTALEEWPRLATLLEQAGWQPTTSQSRFQIELDVWRKLAVNCVINPLTALNQCRNGELLQQQTFEGIMKQVLEEVSKVAIKSCRISTTTTKSNADENNDLEEQQQRTRIIHEQLSETSLRDLVLQVVHGTAQNRSSMLQDFDSINAGGGRTCTEIGYLNGYVVKQGQLLGIPCPANQELLDNVQEWTTKTVTTRT